MWREILHMVNEDVATNGGARRVHYLRPSLRWAAMGMNLIYHLAGGENRHATHAASVRSGAEMALDEAEAPELTEQLIDRMVARHHRNRRRTHAS